MPVACQSRAGTEPAGETQSLLLRQSETAEMKCFGGFLLFKLLRICTGIHRKERHLSHGVRQFHRAVTGQNQLAFLFLRCIYIDAVVGLLK